MGQRDSLFGKTPPRGSAFEDRPGLFNWRKHMGLVYVPSTYLIIPEMENHKSMKIEKILNHAIQIEVYFPTLDRCPLLTACISILDVTEDIQPAWQLFLYGHLLIALSYHS